MEIKFTHIYMDKWDKKEHKSNLKLDLRTYNAVFKHVSLRLGNPKCDKHEHLLCRYAKISSGVTMYVTYSNFFYTIRP